MLYQGMFQVAPLVGGQRVSGVSTYAHARLIKIIEVRKQKKRPDAARPWSFLEPAIGFNWRRAQAAQSVLKPGVV